MGHVAIIILQYGNAASTIDCIKSVLKYNTYPVKFIVVDNCSPDVNDREQISAVSRDLFDVTIEVDDNFMPEKPLPVFTLVRSVANDGYARGNNKGLRLAYADNDIDYVLILNNDTLFVEDIVPKLVADVDTLPHAALVTPLLYKKNLDGIDMNCARNANRMRDFAIINLLLLRIPTFIKRHIYVNVKPDTGCHKVPLVSGSCIMCRKDVFESIDSFDPRTFLYWEEDILGAKIRRIGRCNYVDTDIRCIHLGAATTRNEVSFNMIRHSIESGLYYANNYWNGSSFKMALLRLATKWSLTVYSIHCKLRKRKK